jgi:dihydroorotase
MTIKNGNVYLGRAEGLGIDASGLCVLPAGVDAQVHMRVPGQPDKETAATGVAAALAGGVGTMLTMPNTKPVIDSIETVHLARAELAATALSGVEILLSAAITVGQKGQEAVDFLALAEAGVRAFTDDGLGVASDELMRQAFAASAETGLPILQHAEMPGHGAVLASGPVQSTVTPNKIYAPEIEADMVERDLRLLRDYPGARYHVLHVSAAKTLQLIAKAKLLGLPVTCEVSPHHLYFSSEDIDADNTAFKMNPPLRSKEDQRALRNGLAEGLVDFVATDHAPHDTKSKGKDFKTAAFGTTGLETSLSVLMTLQAAGELTQRRLVEVFASEPARFLGVAAGDIQDGGSARLTIFDRRVVGAVSESDLASKSHNNCFVGTSLAGRVVGMVLGDRLHGRFFAGRSFAGQSGAP